jgi:hypothetical protein
MHGGVVILVMQTVLHAEEAVAADPPPPSTPPPQGSCGAKALWTWYLSKLKEETLVHKALYSHVMAHVIAFAHTRGGVVLSPWIRPWQVESVCVWLGVRRYVSGIMCAERPTVV